MSKKIVTETAGKLKHEMKMTPHYFLRKLSYLTEMRHAPEKKEMIVQEKDTVLKNFKLHLKHYQKDRKVIDAMMKWIYYDKIEEPRLWTMYGRYLIDNMKMYDLKSLIYASNMIVKYEIPYGLFHSISQRFLSEDISVLTSREISIICKQAKNEDVLRKVQQANRIQITNEFDLYFFTSAFLQFHSKFQDVMQQLQSELEKTIPVMKNVPTICKMIREYGDYRITLPDSVIQSLETTVCNDSLCFTQLELNEILVTIRSEHYFNRVSNQFWANMEAKLLRDIRKYHGSWLLSTLARHGFPSTKIMEAVVPRWIEDVDRRQSKEIFREGLCALTKYQNVSEKHIEWCVSQAVFFRQHFNALDVSTIMRALVGPGWYSPTLWKVLVDRFFSPVLTPPKDIDKGMVYFALKSLEIDQVDIPIIRGTANEKRELFKEAYERGNFHSHANRMHKEVEKTMRYLGLEYKKFQKVAILYAPDFVVEREKAVVICQEWPFHITAHTKRLSVSAEMMFRHFNKAGYSVIIVANDHDLPTHLKAVLTRIHSTTHPVNLQIV